jgi:hypothetical protein
LKICQRWTVAGLLAPALVAGVAHAQELTPRAYAPNPTGGNIFLVGYARSTGAVLFDPVLPVDDVDAIINVGTFVYGRTFGLFGRSAGAQVVVPYVGGSVDGFLDGALERSSGSGLGDVRGKLTVNLLGGPALSPREFAASRPKTILGVSVEMMAPTGEYEPSELVNIGANRWSVKPEVGVSRTHGHWYVELYGGVWFFGTNTNFNGGLVREQAPMGALQAHVSYFFQPRLWVAADWTFYTGGRTTVAGAVKVDLVANSRFGLTLAVPLARRAAVRVAWSTGMTTRIGSDFDTLSVGLQLVWFRGS